MIFSESPLQGAFLIDIERIEDTRGFFARSWCREEFESRGLSVDLSQCNICFNRTKGTLRGMHFQVSPHQEAKLVRCTSGAIFDVVIDLRADSPTFRHWFSCELTSENRRMLYVPEGFAHGFQTLEDDVEVYYQMSAPYHEESALVILWNDPTVGIEWPIASPILSARDRAGLRIDP